MSFFDEFLPPPRSRGPTSDEFPPPWSGPRQGWVGGWVPWHLVLLRSADVHTELKNVEAFHSGVAFTTITRFRPGVITRHGQMGLWGSVDGPLFGVGFADERKTMFRPHGGLANLTGTSVVPDDEERGPTLWHSGRAHSGQYESVVDMWLWPLPPPGELRFVAAWPARGIPETTTTVDAHELIAAASRSEQLWEIPPFPR